jgi:HD-GYP domain-containing protein (c-di-GMP phosphodiesterase class II)
MFIAVRRGLPWAAVAGLACLGLTWLGALGALATSGAVFSPLYPTIGLAFGMALMTAATVTVERRRADTATRDVASAVHRAETAGRETSKAQRLMIETLLSLTETRDADTGKHSRRTSRNARLLAEALAKHPAFSEYLTPSRIEALAMLAPLHDIGKVGVPDAVLNKPGALTPDERAEMQRHPTYGKEVICRAEREAGIIDDAILSLAKEMVYTHHEWWDGSGYPQGLKGADIPIPGRIMAVVDVYDACTNPRVYQSALSHERAIERIAKGRGTHFDPDVVDAFLGVAQHMTPTGAIAGS